jgi:tetratricopeptide (TPR) repeat protein
MKAEHRKELMTNTLAHRLGEAVQGMKEGPSRGTLFVLAAAGVILILILIWRYLATSAEESDSARWLKWDSLTTRGQLKAFVEDKEMQGQPQGRLGRLDEARRALHNGLQQLGSPGTRKDALADIQKAAELYDQLAGEFADKPLLHQQVLMGAGKAHESLGDAEQARTYYQQLKDKYSNTVFGEDAAKQLQRLDEAEQNGSLKALRDEFNKPAAP